jgi:hypothetical protein
MGLVLQLGNVVYIQWRTLAADAILASDAGHCADVTAQLLSNLLKGKFRVCRNE